MNRNTFASLTLCLIVVILTACQPVKPTPTATDQIVTMISATATVAPTLASATVPPTFAPDQHGYPHDCPDSHTTTSHRDSDSSQGSHHQHLDFGQRNGQ